MKIHVDVESEEQNIHIPTVYIPNALFRSPNIIRKLLEKAEIEMDDQTIEKIAEHVSEYVHLYKGTQLLEVEVYSKDGEYVYVQITV